MPLQGIGQDQASDPTSRDHHLGRTFTTAGVSTVSLVTLMSGTPGLVVIWILFLGDGISKGCNIVLKRPTSRSRWLAMQQRVTVGGEEMSRRGSP